MINKINILKIFKNFFFLSKSILKNLTFLFCGKFFLFPVDKLSKTIILELCINLLTRFEPIKPAPPVINIFSFTPSQ